MKDNINTALATFVCADDSLEFEKTSISTKARKDFAFGDYKFETTSIPLAIKQSKGISNSLCYNINTILSVFLHAKHNGDRDKMRPLFEKYSELFKELAEKLESEI